MKRVAFASILLASILALNGCRVIRAAAQVRRAQAISKIAPDRQTTLAGVDVAVWKPQASCRRPLVIFSHGYHGSNLQSKFLMRALADDGYLVVAPNHKDSMRYGDVPPQKPFGKP